MTISLGGSLPAGAAIAEARRRSVNVRWVLDRLPADACVRWPGRHDRQGYGWIASQVSHLAHRYIWILLFREPALPELDHVRKRGCRFRDCCNPAHLEPVTTAENARRRAEAAETCSNGHPYVDDDIYWYRGKRYCRACRRDNDRHRPSGGARARRAA